jgi:hypothetical protein
MARGHETAPAPTRVTSFLQAAEKRFTRRDFLTSCGTILLAAGAAGATRAGAEAGGGQGAAVPGVNPPAPGTDSAGGGRGHGRRLAQHCSHGSHGSHGSDAGV